MLQLHDKCAVRQNKNISIKNDAIHILSFFGGILYFYFLFQGIVGYWFCFIVFVLRIAIFCFIYHTTEKYNTQRHLQAIVLVHLSLSLSLSLLLFFLSTGWWKIPVDMSFIKSIDAIHKMNDMVYWLYHWIVIPLWACFKQPITITLEWRSWV